MENGLQNGLISVLRYIDFEKNSGGRPPPDPPNKRGFISLSFPPLKPLGSKLQLFSAPPATTSLGPALMLAACNVTGLTYTLKGTCHFFTSYRDDPYLIITSGDVEII